MHLHPRRRRYGFETMTLQMGYAGGDYEAWLEEHQPVGAGGWRGGGITNNDWTARPWHMPEHLHHTHWTVNQALRFLEARDPTRPFFLVVSFSAPHPPLVPPAFYFERYLRAGAGEGADAPVIGDWCSPPPMQPPYTGHGNHIDSSVVHLTGEALRSCRAGYYGLINHIDDEIRRILTPTASPLPPDTFTLFTADHGEMLGDHHLFRKGQPYDPSARIPLLVRGPRGPHAAKWGIGRGMLRDEPVCLEDIMPTCLDLAGVDIPPSVEGRTLLPLLRGQTGDWRPHLHGEHVHGRTEYSNHFLTDGKTKYIWLPTDGREQLFDLASDPRECRNLAADPVHADLLATWRDRLIEHLRNRPEGFTDGRRLIPGRPYQSLLPHAQPGQG